MLFSFATLDDDVLIFYHRRAFLNLVFPLTYWQPFCCTRKVSNQTERSPAPNKVPTIFPLESTSLSTVVVKITIPVPAWTKTYLDSPAKEFHNKLPKLFNTFWDDLPITITTFEPVKLLQHHLEYLQPF